MIAWYPLRWMREALVVTTVQWGQAIASLSSQEKDCLMFGKESRLLQGSGVQLSTESYLQVWDWISSHYETQCQFCWNIKHIFIAQVMNHSQSSFWQIPIIFIGVLSPAPFPSPLSLLPPLPLSLPLQPLEFSKHSCSMTLSPAVTLWLPQTQWAWA